MPAGRPSIYTPELAAKVLSYIAQGKSLRKTCALPGMPSKSCFLEWVSANEKLADHYTRALELRADHGFDELIELADKATPKNTQVIKLRIETRKWAYAKMRPRKYGEFQRTEVTGENGGALQVRTLSDDDINRRIAQLLRKNGTPHPLGGEGSAPAHEQVEGVLS